jgi:hypothetical protein
LDTEDVLQAEGSILVNLLLVGKQLRS